MSQLLNYWSHIFKEHSCPSRLFQYIDVPHNFPLAKQKMFSIEDNGRYIFFQNSKLDDCQHLNRLNNLGGCPKMPFFPNSSLYSKNYSWNINHMPVVIFFVCLDFGKNCYSRTAS